MKYSFDLSNVNFQTLKEGGYDEKLIEALEHNNFEYLKRGEIKQKLENREFVEPLLYACINSKNAEMFQIYAELEDGIQTQLLTDYNLSCNILLNAPKVIKDTPLAEDERAILANVNEKPEIVRYISNDLMDNPTFVSELSEKNPEVVKELIEKCSVDKLIAANPNLVNNYQFFRQASENNKEVIEYAIKNSDKLGLEAINGVKDSALEGLKENTLNSFNEEEKSEKNIKRSIEFLSNKENDSLLQARAVSHALRKKENVSEEELEELFNLAELLKISLEKTMEENPEYVLSEKDLKGLINHRELTNSLNKSPLKDDEKWVNKIKEYNKFVQGIRKDINKNKQKTQEQIKTQEHNAELSINMITITVSRDGIEQVITYNQTQPEGIQLTEEQLKQLEADLAVRKVERENVQEVETPKRGIATLREGQEQEGQDR